MGATLDALHRLQTIEDALREVRGQIESKVRGLQAQKRRLARLEQEIAETDNQIKQAQSGADKLELDRKSHETHIARLRDALNQAKSNKEYAAVLTQLNIDKANALKLEDAVLAGLGKVDELKKRRQQLRESLEAERARVAAAEREAESQSAGLKARLAALEADRLQAADGIPPETLQTFERTCEHHDGEALARVQRAHPKRSDYICGGCNMGLPLEIINALQSRDLVQQCPNCRRILYIDAPGGVGV